jgi:hypothetical protein
MAATARLGAQPRIEPLDNIADRVTTVSTAFLYSYSCVNCGGGLPLGERLACFCRLFMNCYGTG